MSGDEPSDDDVDQNGDSKNVSFFHCHLFQKF